MTIIVRGGMLALPPIGPTLFTLTRIQENRRRRGNLNALMDEPHLSRQLGVWEPDVYGRGWCLHLFEHKGGRVTNEEWRGYG